MHLLLLAYLVLINIDKNVNKLEKRGSSEREFKPTTWYRRWSKQGQAPSIARFCKYFCALYQCLSAERLCIGCLWWSQDFHQLQLFTLHSLLRKPAPISAVYRLQHTLFKILIKILVLFGFLISYFLLTLFFAKERKEIETNTYKYKRPLISSFNLIY